MPLDLKRFETAMQNVLTFSHLLAKVRLRSYQQAVAQSVARSVRGRLGLSLVVMFPRQSGKNELQAVIETYLLMIFKARGAEMVKVSPTWRPQTLNAMHRLERALERCELTAGCWRKESGYIYRLGQARLAFFSGAPEAHIVGATASTLLEVDEAQDVSIEKYDKEIAPMAASANATRIFWGTAWTNRTLLYRELELARQAELRDGLRRVFVCDADAVGAEVPAYRVFVEEQVRKLGRRNPAVRSQYFNETIDAEGGMFPAARRALMAGSHPAQRVPQPGKTYCLLLDVAGEDEGRAAGPGGAPSLLENPGRDATALTIVEVDPATLADPLIRAPTYRVVMRRQWVGVKHAVLYAELRALAHLWRARWLVIDATGVGAGLASFLERALPGRVIRFVFSGRSKSDLGWGFLGVVETGRFQDFRFQNLDFRFEEDAPDPEQERLRAEFWRQLEFCEFQIVPGAEKAMRWGVPDGRRDGRDGELVHDDLLVSAALCSVLDEREWTAGGPALVVKGKDPLEEMKHF